jgi:anti-sigma-K factor RskA
MKDMKGVTGEVVWSDEKQAGFIRIRGLAVKGAPDYCYQLWIFDRMQDKATPIDGGIFDVNSDGEMIVPITAKIKPEGPTMFALTLERHGGVVVSKRDKIAAIAKV